jgi:hypothetical protein
MGNCDFKKNEPDNNAGISKANFQMHYVIGKGGYGKVNVSEFIKSRSGRLRIKKKTKIMP